MSSRIFEPLAAYNFGKMSSYSLVFIKLDLYGNIPFTPVFYLFFDLVTHLLS